MPDAIDHRCQPFCDLRLEHTVSTGTVHTTGTTTVGRATSYVARVASSDKSFESFCLSLFFF